MKIEISPAFPAVFYIVLVRMRGGGSSFRTTRRLYIDPSQAQRYAKLNGVVLKIDLANMTVTRAFPESSQEEYEELELQADQIMGLAHAAQKRATANEAPPAPEFKRRASAKKLNTYGDPKPKKPAKAKPMSPLVAGMLGFLAGNVLSKIGEAPAPADPTPEETIAGMGSLFGITKK